MTFNTGATLTVNSGAGTNLVSTLGSYANPSWITSLAWSKITGAPSTGTVTSVAFTAPSGFSVSGSPVTDSGTIALTTSLSGILKGTGTGFTAATAGTDYLTPTGNGSGLTGLTKTQVGLSNVENTALSTWAGTTNLTTLGTVGAGTWSATAIAASKGGVPTGGTSGQVLTKNSGTNYDASWANSSVGVSSVGLSAPSVFSVSGSPVTGTGTLTLTFATGQTANRVLASPDGISGAITLRALVANDIPSLTLAKISDAGTAAAKDVSFFQTPQTSAAAYGIFNGSTIDSWGTKSVPSGAVVGTTDIQTITNKTIGVGQLSGTISASNMPALTGDVTSSSGSVSTIISAGSVSLSKMANLASMSLIGNNTGSSTTPIALSASQTKTMLSIGSGDLTGLSLGDTLYGNISGSASILSGNTTGTAKALMQTGTGGVSAAPSWIAIPTSITGTSNEISASASTGSVTLSLPSSLTFTGKTITGGTFASGAFNGTVGATTPSSIVASSLRDTALSSSLIKTDSGGTMSNATAGTDYVAATTGSYLLYGSSGNTANATLGTHLSFSGGNLATDATNANTASAIVARDASGNFSAGTITAALTGTASNASQLLGATWASPSAIGGTTPNSAAFTTISSTSNVDFFPGSNLGTQVSIGNGSSAPAPGFFMSGEPGISVNNVILSFNYHALSGSLSGRQNTSLGGSFIRLTQNEIDLATIDSSGTEVGSATFTSSGINNTVIGATIPAAATFTTISTSSNANLRTTKGNLHLTVNVKDYGAVGDGATDDWSAINSAVSALANHGTLFFPAGKYRTTDGWTFDNLNYITVEGSGAEIYVDAPSKSVSTLTHSTTTATCTTSSAHGWTTGASVTIAGASPSQYNGTFTITVTGATTFTYTMGSDPGSNATGTIYAQKNVQTFVFNSSCSNIDVHNLAITGSSSIRGNGVHVRMYADNAKMAHCDISGASDFGVLWGDTTRYTTNGRITDCSFSSTIGDGLHISGVSDFIASDCIFNSTGDDSIGIVADSLSYAPARVNVVGMKIYNAGTSGHGCGVRIVDGCTDVMLNDVQVYTSAEAGVYVGRSASTTAYNSRIVLSKIKTYNTTTATGMLASVNLSFMNDSDVDGCTIQAPATGGGIALLDCNQTIVHNCFVKTCPTRGIATDDGTTSHVASNWDRITIKANTIQDCGTGGSAKEAIYMVPASGLTISNLDVEQNTATNTPATNYIFTNRLATAAKVGNNTSMEGRSVANGGSGISPTTFNNN